MFPTPDLASPLVEQRWFGGKGKTIRAIDCLAELSLIENAAWRILAVDYTDGTRELYQVPAKGDADAFTDGDFRLAVLRLLSEDQTINAGLGVVRVRRFSDAPAATTSRLLAIEQSNSSVAYGAHLFLKVFRKLENGINPDIEILARLSRQSGCVRVPEIYATLELELGGETYALGVLLEMVTNQGNAWEMALAAARDGQNFLGQAALLGKRTAELHLALGNSPDDPAFGVQISSEAYWQQTVAEIWRDTLDLLDVLEARGSSLTGESARLAREFVANAPAELEKIAYAHPSFPLTRIHGDYHLGQVLAAGDDFVIIDFEGEPARPLAERRKHRSPLIDVAGMLRSFHYAGCMAGVESWDAPAGAAFLEAYWGSALGSPVLPDAETAKMLLETFLWQKKIYEIRYELNNRPDWLWIPLK